MRARLGSSGKVQHVMTYGEAREFGSFRATLLPAGHMLGSAQILIEQGGERLLYTGDFKLRKGLSSEPAESVRADTLIMETTFGLPRYKFPPSAKTVARIISFCREALTAGEVPVLLGYSLGKAQEILAGLSGAGLPVMLHGSVWQMTRLYEELGSAFPAYSRYEPGSVNGHVLLCPPSTARSAMIENIPSKRVAMITGWGIDARSVHRYRCDAVFPLSDHADYGEITGTGRTGESLPRPDPARFCRGVRPRSPQKGHRGLVAHRQRPDRAVAGVRGGRFRAQLPASTAWLPAPSLHPWAASTFCRTF